MVSMQMMKTAKVELVEVDCRGYALIRRVLGECVVSLPVNGKWKERKGKFQCRDWGQVQEVFRTLC